MTNEQATNMLKAKLECLKRDTSGTDFDCNNRDCEDCLLCYEQGNMEEQKEALDMAIKALEKERWIPVSERLPEERGLYIVTEKVYCVDDREHTGRFNLMTEQVEFDNGKWRKAHFYEVIAWMPLPEPYKAES